MLSFVLPYILLQKRFDFAVSLRILDFNFDIDNREIEGFVEVSSERVVIKSSMG